MKKRYTVELFDVYSDNWITALNTANYKEALLMFSELRSEGYDVNIVDHYVEGF